MAGWGGCVRGGWWHVKDVWGVDRAGRMRDGLGACPRGAGACREGGACPERSGRHVDARWEGTVHTEGLGCTRWAAARV